MSDQLDKFNELLQTALESAKFDMIDSITIMSYMPGILETMEACKVTLSNIEWTGSSHIAFRISTERAPALLILYNRGSGASHEFMELNCRQGTNWYNAELPLNLDTTEEHVLWYVKRICNWANGKGPRR